MSHLPVPAPVTALRALRRAAWWGAELPDLIDARAVLAAPMGDLAVAWVQFSEALDAYVALRCSERFNALQAALWRLDETATAFFGPSGWEQTRDRPPDSQTSKP